MKGLRPLRVDLGINESTGLKEIADVWEININLGKTNDDLTKDISSQFIQVWYDVLVLDKNNKVMNPRNKRTYYKLIEREAIVDKDDDVVTPADTSLSDWDATEIAAEIAAAIEGKLKIKHNID